MVKTANKSKSGSKPSRKEMKQPDQFVEVGTQSLDWVHNHRHQILAGIAAVLVISLGVFLFFYMQERGDRSATNALGEALKVYQAKISKDGDASGTEKTYKTEAARNKASLEAFEKLVQSHGASRSGAFASLYVGHIYAKQKDFTKAQAAYEKFIQSFPANDPLRFLGIDALAYVLSQSKKEKESIEQLKRFSEDGAPIFRSFALMRLAKHYEAQKDLKKAIHFYGLLSKDKLNKEYQKEAKKRSAILALQAGVKTDTQEDKPAPKQPKPKKRK
ncbi:MAG: tetratricopeptide repeat protein [Myxococcales bacterium]|nr:tetratricopeptide repeat protein [Myxococcales bacterium]MCB9642903.1 tetratricopeptide repeat protein [Myxococcales bacterium]